MTLSPNGRKIPRNSSTRRSICLGGIFWLFVANQVCQGAELTQGAKCEERNRSGDRYRFLVILGDEKSASSQKVCVDQLVSVGEPFDLRPKTGLTAKGVLSKAKDGKLQFRGNVTVGNTTGVYDSPVELGQSCTSMGFGASGFAVSLFVRFESPKHETVGAMPHAWSKSVDGLRARLQVKYELLGTVHREPDGKVSISGLLATVEFENSSRQTLAVGNYFQVTAKVIDSDGREVKGATIRSVSGSVIGSKWALVPKGAYVGWPADSRSHLYLPVSPFVGRPGFTHLEIGVIRWKLRPGRYTVESKLKAPLPSAHTMLPPVLPLEVRKRKTRPSRYPLELSGQDPLPLEGRKKWLGEINLPPIEVIVTDKQVVAQEKP
jgi:hypothetical protein